MFRKLGAGVKKLTESSDMLISNNESSVHDNCGGNMISHTRRCRITVREGKGVKLYVMMAEFSGNCPTEWDAITRR